MNYTNQKEINGTEKDIEYANGTRRRKSKKLDHENVTN